MDVILCTHVIPSINTLIEVKEKNQVRLELDMYVEQLMHIATSKDLQMSVDTMHQYVTGMAALKTMIHMLSNKLDIGAKLVYLNIMEARVQFQKDVTIEYTDTITDYQSYHLFTTTNHEEHVNDLVFP